MRDRLRPAHGWTLRFSTLGNFVLKELALKMVSAWVEIYLAGAGGVYGWEHFGIGPANGLQGSFERNV